MNELVKITEVFARNKPPQTSGKSTLCSHHLLVQEDTSTPQAKTTEEEAFLESERAEAFLESERALSVPKKLSARKQSLDCPEALVQV